MLEVQHEEQEFRLEDGDLTFGRTGMVVIGPENQFVHRIVGRFVRTEGVWWLENRAQHLPIQITSTDGSRVDLPALSATGAPSRAALVGPTFRVGFSAGGIRYQLDGAIAEAVALPEPADAAGMGTETIHAVVLTAEERQMLQALARPVLRSENPGPDLLPSNRNVARELGWPDTKLNRKLDYLCTRLTKLGFEGLKGDLGGEAKLRRWRLVEYAIAHGMVGLDDERTPTGP